MNKKPFIERLKTAYDRNRYAWFVIDGQGNTMHEGLDETTAREYSMKDSDYSIGFAHTMPMRDEYNLDKECPECGNLVEWDCTCNLEVG